MVGWGTEVVWWGVYFKQERLSWTAKGVKKYKQRDSSVREEPAGKRPASQPCVGAEALWKCRVSSGVHFRKNARELPEFGCGPAGQNANG